MATTRKQIAALPLRWGDRGDVEVLMITSRDTGRWIVPKGWTMDGIKPWRAAAIEALEEAGARGDVGRDAFGTYRYDKIMDDGSSVPVKVRVYPMLVERLASSWKEQDERTRRWFGAEAAASLVDEPELAELLMALTKKPKKLPVVGRLLRRAAS